MFTEISENDLRFKGQRMVRVQIRPMDAVRLLALAKESGFINRRPSENVVDMLGRELLEGRWCVNGETIAISTTGVPLNGYQRLNAVIRTGVPLCTWACVGVDESSHATFDNVRKRSAADAFAHLEKKYVTVRGAATRLLLDYEGNPTGSIHNTKVFSPQEIVKYEEKHADEIEPVLTEVAPHLSTFKMIPSGPLVMGWVVFRRIAPSMADEFMRKLLSGEGIEKGEPVGALRARLIQDASYGKHSSMKLTVPMRSYFLFRAFQATLFDQRIERMQPPKGTLNWPALTA